jgi:hypothetical protein
MEGFGVHTFMLLNSEGRETLVKFHWKPTCGECACVSIVGRGCRMLARVSCGVGYGARSGQGWCTQAASLRRPRTHLLTGSKHEVSGGRRL